MWYITSYGDKHAAQTIEGIGDSARNVRPAFEEIYLTILDIEDELFEKEGARGAFPKWAPITVLQQRWKQKRNLDPHILQAYGDLRRSLTVYRHPDQRIRIEATKIVFGTRLEKGKWLYKGWKQPIKPFKSKAAGRRGRLVTKSGVPGRPFVRFTESDAHAFGREIMRHLLRPTGTGRIQVIPR